MFLADVDRHSLQLFCSFVKFITSHTGCYVGVDSESVPEIITHTSFPVMHRTIWGSELDFTPSVGFVSVELAFTRVTCRWIHHPSLAFQYVIYYHSIVVSSIIENASEDAVVLIHPRCSLSLIASMNSGRWMVFYIGGTNKTSCRLIMRVLSFKGISSMSPFAKAMPSYPNNSLTSARKTGNTREWRKGITWTICCVLCFDGCLCCY